MRSTPRRSEIGPMMARQDGYNHHRHLMSAIDTDIDSPEGQRSPSPPPLRLAIVPKYVEQQQNIDHLDNAPPQTPYYDYACNFPLWYKDD